MKRIDLNVAIDELSDKTKELALATLVVERDMMLTQELNHRIMVLHGGQVLSKEVPVEVTRIPHVRDAFLGANINLKRTSEPAGVVVDDVSTSEQ